MRQNNLYSLSINFIVYSGAKVHAVLWATRTKHQRNNPELIYRESAEVMTLVNSFLPPFSSPPFASIQQISCELPFLKSWFVPPS